MTTEPTLTDRIADLARPFPIDHVQVRPGAVTTDGTAAIALPYVDWRLYAERLDQLVGPADWSIQLIPWGPTRLIARLTILGVTKDASGEGDPNDVNCGTIAEAQAKKRACAEFGLGRYFYTLPKVWGKGSGSKRDFRFAEGEAQRCTYEMYRRATLLPTPEPRIDRPPSIAASADPRTSTLVPTRRPEPAQLAKARAALERAEQRSGLAPAAVAPGTSANGAIPRTASAKQRNSIVTLLEAARGRVQPGTLNQLGQQIGSFGGLSGVLKPNGLPPGLSSTQASRLIERLQQLTTSDITA
jgi:hypothetical protein